MMPDATPRESVWQRARAALVGFVSDPASPRPLAVMRIGLSAVLLAQALSLARDLLELYGGQGLVQWSVVEGLASPGVPRVSQLAHLLAALGVSEATCVRGVFLLYFAGLAGLLLGWRTRWAALLAWLARLTLSEGGTLSLYGVDQFAHFSLFYCLFMPVGDDLSLNRRAGRVAGRPAAAARLSLRVLQLHLCIAYFAAGIDKAVGEQWWNGEAIWRATMRPDMGRLDVRWLAGVPWLAMLLGWGAVLIEVGYPVFMWPKLTRRAWGVATLGLHAGIAVAMGLWSFSALMGVLTVSAFLVPADPASTDPTEPGRGEGGQGGRQG